MLSDKLSIYGWVRIGLVAGIVLSAPPPTWAADEKKPLELARQEYLSKQSYDSLVRLHSELEPGMSRAEVEALLGSDGYAPTEGLLHYASSKRVEIGGFELIVGLVLDFRNPDRDSSNNLKSIYFGPIGE